MLQAQVVYFAAPQKLAVVAIPPHGATIGRSSACTFTSTDAKVSQQHAALKLIRDTWHIEDQCSTNGTLVNGSRITTPIPLRHMDIIACGSLQLRFMLVSGSEQATLAGRDTAANSKPAEDFARLRSEITRLKKEHDDLLAKLDQEGRELTGCTSSFLSFSGQRIRRQGPASSRVPRWRSLPPKSVTRIRRSAAKTSRCRKC